MRIDVEVYKGPLSKEPMIQFGDLLGFIDEVKRGLNDMNNFTDAVALNKDFNNDISKSKVSARDFSRKFRKWCDGLDAAGAWDQIDFFDCLLLKELRLNQETLYKELNKYANDLQSALTSPNRQAVEHLLVKLSTFAGTMRKNAFSWTIPGTAGHTPNFKVRIAMVVYIVATAEYGNQLHARIDALIKQLHGGGFDRRELPLSVYISDTEPTDFVHLFDQWDAATDRSWAWLGTAAIDGTVNDRINMVKRLFADHHWSKINTAYASGWGKTSMAFVKDDIGNWNLKNFDNAPGELLDGYTKVAKTALDRAATLAADIHSGGSASAIQSLVKLSRDISLPSQGQSSHDSSALLTEFHHRTEIKLREAGWAAIAEEAKSSGKLPEQKEIRSNLINSLNSILRDHGELVDLSVQRGTH